MTDRGRGWSIVGRIRQDPNPTVGKINLRQTARKAVGPNDAYGVAPLEIDDGRRSVIDGDASDGQSNKAGGVSRYGTSRRAIDRFRGADVGQIDLFRIGG